MSLENGTIINQYKIISSIGKGGMGEVFLAQDTKLDRKVALKILPSEFAEDKDRMGRFVREAKSASALNHPNIITIHEIGESDGTHFIATEFVVGKTLSAYAKGHPLNYKSALEIAIQVASALDEAHAAGIVHRDIKPDNVMVRANGLVKLLDFGIAKLSAPTATDGEAATAIQSQTQPGMIIGTPNYMSPEQARGKDVNHQTDIFSFGVVLYEMLSGSSPFKGETVSDVIAAVLTKEPQRLNEIPKELEEIVNKTLQKDKGERYQTAKALLIDLQEAKAELEFQSKFVVRPSGGIKPNEVQTQILSARTPAEAVNVTKPISNTNPEVGFWVAVLPFKCSTADADLAALADGLSEEVVTGLSRFRYLSVVTSASAARLKGDAGDERTQGAELGARYVMEGSIRKGGSAIRVSAQLVDTQTGAQLWSETYNRDLQTSTIFAVQDDVAARIVATVADSYGVLVHSMRDAIRQKDDADLTPAEWQFQYFAYREQITPSNHAALKSRVELAAKSDNQPSDLWACLAQVYVDEYGFGFPGNDGTSLDRALVAARRAVELNRANQFAMVALAQAHFFRQDLAAFGPAAERAMALNPLNTDALGILGLEIVHTGEFERGTAIVRRAMELNANHAGWMHFAPLWDHFHKGEYEQALECANRVDVPGLFWPFLVMASACGHLERRTEAAAALRDLLALDPEFAAHARSYVGTWHFASGLMDPLLDGLRRAGLEIDEDRPADASAALHASGETSVDEGFWVAVLPFKATATNTGLSALAEGLSEDIVTGLSRFSYLRVIARGSTLRYANQTQDLRRVGKEVGARYVMEGTLRQAGSKLRLAVQLLDATTGTHLWAENYEREFSTETIFELQDDLVPRIVSTVADWYGALPHSMSESVRLKPPDQLSPYEALLRSFGYFENIAAEEHALVRSGLERAVGQEPGNADAWAMLSMLFGEEHRFGFNVEPDSLGRSLEAARHAVGIAHANHFAWLALAQALFFRKEFDAFRDAAERALTLNPMDGSTVEYLGHLIAFSGNWERGCELAERARQLNPNHPSWYWSVPFLDAYRKGDYVKARGFLLKGNPQRNWLMHALLAAAQGQLGESEAATRHLREVLKMMPNFPSIARDEFSKWYLPELVDHLMDGLRKAGLETADETQLPTSSPSLVSGETRAGEGFWVAVLPFKATGTNPELSTLAEGLSDEIVTGLNRFSYLRVISRSSTLKYASQTSDVRSVGKALGARYVMEGNVRQAGPVIRVTVQLADANTGAHLWVETYDRPFRPEEIFALQDDLVPRIVSTVADQHGVLPHSMSEVVRAQDPDQLTAYETLLRGFRYYEGVSANEHATMRASLERALETSPANADCWAMLGIMYCDEHKFGFNQLPDSLDRALNAAQRAVEISPTNPFAYEALAQALFFRREFDSFRNAAERAIALNPMDGATNAFMGILIAFTGDWDYGCAVAERATQLNPHYPGWYWNAAFYNAYRKRDYKAALKITLEFNMPGLFYHHVNRAAVYGQLGDREAASKALKDLLALKPDFPTAAPKELGKWLRPELVEHVIEGLQKAGLEIDEEGRSLTKSTSTAVSSLSRVDEGFWVAVLPFKFTGSNPEVATLAEGLSEEIVTGLSRFSYLRVISRSSTVRYANETDDVREVGTRLGARYVMEGSLRVVGSSLRISVQLIDAGTGAHLWAETYDRQFRSEEVFALQDDLVPRIVSTVADVNGVLPRSMSEVVCSKNPDELSPYEAVLRSFRYFDRVSPDELTAARSCLEIAVEKAPGNADAWAMLALLFHQDYGQGFNLHPDALNLGVSAAQRAVESGPSNHLAYFSLAQARFFQKDVQSFRNAAERAVALNPMDANSVAFMGELLTYVGDSERGLSLAARAKEINPNHPGWFWYADYFQAYRQGDYRNALNLILKANLPGHWGMHAGIAAAAAQLGDSETASKALRDLLKLRPDYGVTVHETLAKWFDPELCEQLLEGLRKAGLEIGDEGTERHGDGATDSAVSPPLLVTTSPLHPVPPSSIAVLPFVNISNDPDNEYFCDGLAEELLNALAKIDKLKVAARTSAFSFKGKNTNVGEIGEKLGVATVMEGSVRKTGDHLRISVQLVNAADGYQLWSERYDREMRDIFKVQDEIALAVVDALKLKLFGTEKAAVLKKGTESEKAYELYLKGRFFFNKLTKAGIEKSIEFYEQAIAIDPNYALAYVGISDTYFYLSIPDSPTAYLSPKEALPKVMAAAERAIEIDDQLAEAWASLAHIKEKSCDLQGAKEAYRRSFDLDMNQSLAHSYYGAFLSALGEHEQALQETQLGQEIDPFSVLINSMPLVCLNYARRYDEGIGLWRKLRELELTFPTAGIFGGVPYVQTKRYAEAVEIFRQAVESSNRSNPALAALGHAYAVSGNRTEAEKLLRELVERSKDIYVSPYGIALIYAGLGEKDKAIESLVAAYEEANLEIIFLNVEPRFDSLRDDPRFQDIIRRIGFPSDKTIQPDESLARTVTLSTGGATSTPPAKDLATRPAETKPPTEDATNPPSAIRNPKSKWWLFGLLGLLVLVGGFFSYRYFTSTKQIESIAVMPFVNESGNADVEYLSDGMTETLIKSLSNLPNLNVKPRSSVFRYKGKNTDLQTIGKELNVQAILTGRVVQRGDSLTLSLELVDAAKDSVIWTEQYQRKQSDLVFLQSEIARDVSTKLKSKLSGEDSAKVEKSYTANSEAYQLYLKGRYHWNKRTYEDLLKAIEQFKAAIDKDADYALAFAGLADTYSIIPYYLGSRSGDYMRQAKPYAERAVELDGELAETHTSLAFVNEGTWNWGDAEKHYERAIEINPNYSTAQTRYARFEIRVPNRGVQALTRMKRAVELEPSSLVANDNLSQIYLALGEVDASVEQARRTVELDPQYAFGWIDLTYAQIKKGQFADALSSAAKAVEVSKRTTRSLVCLGVANAAAGHPSAAMAIGKELERRYENNQGDATEVAAVYAGLGDKDQAFVWLDKAFADHSSLLVDLRAEYPFAALRDDPRYKILLKRLNLPE